MAGIFGFFDYNKPGPGVPKDAPPKSPFIVFFEILQRKFWNLVRVNLMFLVFNIPALILGMFVMLAFFPNILPDAFESADSLINDTILKFILLSLMMCVPMITTGPSQAGFTYILRNYTREEHAFIWSDFKENALKNLKQSLIVSTINFVATFVILFSIRAYWILIDVGDLANLPGMIGLAIMVMVFIVFACINIYIYPLMVTFDLNLKQLYKNSLIFAIIKFLPNLGILLLNSLIIFLTFGLIIPFSQIIGFIPYIFLTLSLTGFITNFYAYPKLKKFMLSRIEDDEEEEEEDGEEDDQEDDALPAGGEDDNKTDGDDTSESNGENSDDDIKRYF